MKYTKLKKDYGLLETTIGDLTISEDEDKVIIYYGKRKTIYRR